MLTGGLFLEPVTMIRGFPIRPSSGRVGFSLVAVGYRLS